MAGRMGDEGDGETVVLEAAVAGRVGAAVTTGAVGAVDGVVAVAADEADEGDGDGMPGLDGASMTGAVGGSTFGSQPIKAKAATETSAADEMPPRMLVSGARRLVPQKTQAASLERT